MSPGEVEFVRNHDVGEVHQIRGRDQVQKDAHGKFALTGTLPDI